MAEQVGNSALFASRFRECAARALLLPRRNPGKRAPLWQQRQRAEQLLDVARKYPSFPIILETVRECVQDVYDVPALTEVMRELGHRRIRIAEVTTEQPSPFASSLLFNYTGAFMYEGDSPLAEKRAAALALDPALLAKLLGTVELRELLDPEIIAEVHAQLQRTDPSRRARTTEEVADLLRVLGPIPSTSWASTPTSRYPPWTSWARGLCACALAGASTSPGPGCAPASRRPGYPHPSRHPCPSGHYFRCLAAAGLALGAHPWSVCAARSHRGLRHIRLRRAHRPRCARWVVEGRYRQGVEEQEYCAAAVLKTIRSRSLAAARAATEPVSGATFARFLPEWHSIAPAGKRPALRGADGVFSVIEQLAGVRLPASAWESLILPARVGDYSPTMLDELTSNGEVLIVGAGGRRGRPLDHAVALRLCCSTRSGNGCRGRQHGAALHPRCPRPRRWLPLCRYCRRGPGTTEETREALWG